MSTKFTVICCWLMHSWLVRSSSQQQQAAAAAPACTVILFCQKVQESNGTHDLLISTPTLYQLSYHDLSNNCNSSF
jgi:hypothetical protein